MDEEARYEDQGYIDQRYRATQERNCMNKVNCSHIHHRKTLNGIVHCPHGLHPNCPCVQNFSVNESCPLTEQQAKVGTASFIRSEIEKSRKGDPRYFLLTMIIKCDDDKQDDYIREYETKFGPLLTDDLFEIDSSIAHLKSPGLVTESVRYVIKLVLLSSILLKETSEYRN
jgi:hypothetical protein